MQTFRKRRVKKKDFRSKEISKQINNIAQGQLSSVPSSPDFMAQCSLISTNKVQKSYLDRIEPMFLS